MAFTDYETEQLRKALLKETRHCAVTLGMKKTSVDQLTRAVGIAKGSFYKFFESKEMAFFAVLESIHSELYGVADQALHRNGGLPTSERAAEAVLAVCRRLSDTGDMVFIEHDAKLLLQRLPEGVKRNITTMTRRTFVCFWRNMTLCRIAASLWLLPRCGD